MNDDRKQDPPPPAASPASPTDVEPTEGRVASTPPERATRDVASTLATVVTEKAARVASKLAEGEVAPGVATVVAKEPARVASSKLPERVTYVARTESEPARGASRPTSDRELAAEVAEREPGRVASKLPEEATREVAPGPATVVTKEPARVASKLADPATSDPELAADIANVPARVKATSGRDMDAALAMAREALATPVPPRLAERSIAAALAPARELDAALAMAREALAAPVPPELADRAVRAALAAPRDVAQPWWRTAWPVAWRCALGVNLAGAAAAIWLATRPSPAQPVPAAADAIDQMFDDTAAAQLAGALRLPEAP